MHIISYICWRPFWFLTCWRQVLWVTSTESKSFVHRSYLAGHSEWGLSSPDLLNPCCHSEQSHCARMGVANFILYLWTLGDCRKSYWCLNQADEQHSSVPQSTHLFLRCWALLISAVSCVFFLQNIVWIKALCVIPNFLLELIIHDSEYSLDGTRWFYPIKT